MGKRQRIKGNITIILFVFVACLLGLSGRVLYIKEVHGVEYENKAKAQQVERYDLTIAPNRGSIFDRNNQAMAVSTTVYNIVLDPLVLAENTAEEQEKTLNALSQTLDLDYSELKWYITKDPSTGLLNKNNHWVYLKKNIEREVKESLEAMEIKGVVYEKTSKRKYPLETVASHVLGFLRGDTSWGLESQYNDYMVGSPGRSFITYNGASSAVTQEVEAKDGNTVITTLDYTIQQYAEQTVNDIDKDYNPENAAVLVMDPNTGEVIAMASTPGYDPNDPSTPIKLSDEKFKSEWENKTDEQMYEYLNNTWKNFNVSSTFEPGSIFKPLVVAAALEENVINTNTTFYCGGKKVVADTTIGCWYRSGHGTESVEDVIANSCNVGMMDIAEKMGVPTFYKYQLDFGFGSKTGIDLPGEVSAKNLMFTESQINQVELATMSFGQSFNCTPIQMVTAFSSVINGGNLMKPYIVSSVVDKNGSIIHENKPEVVRKVISQETSDIVRTYMKSTVETGTGKKAKIDGYSIGGKTGTAQQGVRAKNEYTLSYIAYLPVESPQYVALVVVHKPKPYIDGVTTPAPYMKSLLEKIIRYKTIEPTSEVSNEEKTSSKVVVDDYVNRSLFDVLHGIDTLGLKYNIIGSGNLVTNQVPPPGTEVDEGTTILVYVTKAEGDENTIPVPNVVGMNYDEAVTTLNDAGFSTIIKGDDVGVVVSQSPNAGISLGNGADVEITLAVKEDKDEKNSE